VSKREEEHQLACDKPTRRRRPSIDALLKEAARAGKTVTSITLPDGTKVNFGEGDPVESVNPWLKELRKQ
jgi:hypothetical protein